MLKRVLAIKNRGMIFLFLVWCMVIISSTELTAANRVQNLGPLEVELPNLPLKPTNTITFNLKNVTPYPIRYFSITCKIMKDGYLIDERICNGFGIEPNGLKEINASFLWLPPIFDIYFEANKIRTEEIQISDNVSRSQIQPAPNTLPEFNYEPDLTDISNKNLKNPLSVGQKITIYNKGTWFP